MNQHHNQSPSYRARTRRLMRQPASRRKATAAVGLLAAVGCAEGFRGGNLVGSDASAEAGTFVSASLDAPVAAQGPDAANEHGSRSTPTAALSVLWIDGNPTGHVARDGGIFDASAPNTRSSIGDSDEVRSTGFVDASLGSTSAADEVRSTGFTDASMSQVSSSNQANSSTPASQASSSFAADSNTAPDRDAGCVGTCEVQTHCGNSVVEQGEECDEGPTGSASCNGPAAGAAGCHAARCGDGFASADEDCDVQTDTATCNGPNAGAYACKRPSCGDSYSNAAAAEQCDTGGETPQCNGPNAGENACQVTTCGDNYVNQAAGEQCEVSHGPACNGPAAGGAACRIGVCGDGYCSQSDSNAGCFADCL